MHTPTRRATLAIIEEANEWLVKLAENNDPATQKAFAAWLRRSPVHVREYLNAETTWMALESVDPRRRMDVEAGCRDSNVVAIGPRSLSDVPPEPRFSHQRRNLFAAAAAIAAFGAGLTWFVQQPATQHFETGVGEQRRVVLRDGSVVDLNTHSSVEVRMTDSARKVELIEGEALFTVAKDPARPFIVTSGPAIAEAIGTQFNVYRQPQRTVITVVEGRVAVMPTQRLPGEARAGGEDPVEPHLQLAPGDQVEVAARVPIRRASVDTARVTAWRERRLIFESQPLRDVIAEFNRYNARQLIIRDPALAAKRISGVFDADKPDALVRFLLQDAAIETVEENGPKLVIQSRK